MILKTIVLCLLFSSLVQAEGLPLFYQGIRPSGMGGAFTAVADDENALFYNPAGLNQGRPGFQRVEILKPTLEFSQNIFPFLNDAQTINETSDKTERANLATDLLNNSTGKNQHIRVGSLSDLIFHHFGIGFLAQFTGDLAVHNLLSHETVRLRTTKDLALLIAGAGHVKNLMLGLTVKWVKRSLVDEGYSARQISEQKLKIPKPTVGEGFAIDVGLLYPVAGKRQTTIGVSLQNIIGGDLGIAGELPFQINLGISQKRMIGEEPILVAADLMDLTMNIGEDRSLFKRIHLGVEYRFPEVLTVRTGLYQGYPSFGTTIDLWLAKLDYAYYTEEIGAFSGQTGDSRHAIQLSIGF